MSPKSKPDFHCLCPLCSIEGGLDGDGKPKGVFHPASHRVAHMQRVKAEAARAAETAARQSVQTDRDRAALIEQLSSDAFVQGFMDQCSEHDQPSRFWSPTRDPQIADTLPRLSNPPVDAVLESLNRLRTTTPSSLKSSEQLEGAFAKPIVPSLHRFNTSGASKAERNHATTKAHNVLDGVEKKIRELQVMDASNLFSLQVDVAHLQKTFDSVKRNVQSIHTRKALLRPHIHDIQRRLSEVLASSIPNNNHPVEYNCDNHFGLKIDQHNPIVQLTMFIAVMCNVMAGVSHRMGDAILGLLTILLRWAFSFDNGIMNSRQEQVVSQIPVTLQTALKKFNLDPVTTTYAVCPNCHCTYAPKFLPGSDKPIYPAKCTNRPSPDNICNANILERIPCTDSNRDGDNDLDGVSNESDSPIKTFVFHSFDDYLAGLLARKDIENLMDAACDNLMESIRNNEPVPDVITDAFHSEFIRSFEDPDEKIFVNRPNDEGRYLFVLNVDFFSAEGQTIRGPTASCGLISMACLNLPLHLRYKPENMYVAGIIPGPKEPSLTQFNHYIRPLIDTFVTSWDRGVRYSQTAKYPKGRLTRCAIAIAVNDLPAARTLAQMGHHTSNHFCSRCKCVGKKNLYRTDITSEDWKPMDISKLREDADAWISAPTNLAQGKLTQGSGCRWTELWRLPYWDPTRMLAVDSMHCILEGITQQHFRHVLQLTDTGAKAAETIEPAFEYQFTLPTEHDKTTLLHQKDDIKDVASIHALLLAPLGEEGDDDVTPFLLQLEKRLTNKHLNPLRFVVGSMGLSIPGNNLPRKLGKKHYAAALVQWRSEQPYRRPYNPANQKLGSRKTMDRILEVIRNTDTPSWIESVPKNFGYAAAGSLKADEWRTMATIYLPLALITLWGEGSDHPSPLVAATLRRVLDHTMNLVSAVIIACKRSMTESRMIAYLDNLIAWKAQLTDIHPSASHTPNSHMAIHIYDFLRLFGPVRSWWCFPFERLIGQLQRLPNNHKFGELEASMLFSFSRGTKLRQWLSRPDCPEFLKECQVLLNKTLGKKEDTDLQEPIKSYALKSVPSELRNLIKDKKIALRARHKEDGVMFARSSTHVGNSLIMFYPNGDHRHVLVPGSIQYIVGRQDAPTVYAVRRQLPCEAGSIDPFRPYPHFSASIYSTSLSSTLELVNPDWVFSHYARYHIDAKRAAVLILSRD